MSPLPYTAPLPSTDPALQPPHLAQLQEPRRQLLPAFCGVLQQALLGDHIDGGGRRGAADGAAAIGAALR